MAATHALLRQTANEMYRNLMMVNLESVRARVGTTKLHMNDYRRFLALKAAHEKLNPIGFAHCCFSPTPEIDQIWHAHILDTRLYMEACAAMGAKGAYVHHDPHGGDDPDVQKARREFTKEAFVKCYGGLPVSRWSSVMDVILGRPNAVDGDEHDDEDDEEGADGAVGDQTNDVDDDAETPAAKRPRTVAQVDKFQIFLRGLTGATKTLVVDGDMSVEALRLLVQEKEKAEPCQQRLIFAGRQMENGHDLTYYKIKKGVTIHLVLRVAGC